MKTLRRLIALFSLPPSISKEALASQPCFSLFKRKLVKLDNHLLLNLLMSRNQSNKRKIKLGKHATKVTWLAEF